MSCIVIGDIHGRRIWEQVLKKHPKDTLVFVGDYFDSKEGFGADEQIKNFKHIIACKSKQKEKVILLTGNHDFHYLPFAGEDYTGFQSFKAIDISETITQAYKNGLLQMGYRFGNYLISHAGLTKKWCKKQGIPFDDPIPFVNNLWQEKPIHFRFNPGKNWDVSGDEPEQGPCWVRPKSLRKNKIPDFWQVVGHTQQPAIAIENGLILVDCLGHLPQYLEITDEGLAIVHTLK